MLPNKLNITPPQELALKEEEISKRKAVEMYENGFLDTLTRGTYKTLATIHEKLFSEIYDFAGKLRVVNISKGASSFAPVLHLESTLKTIEKMPQSTPDEIIQKYVEMNVAHPFRDGNGRATRMWLDLIFKKELSMCIDWTAIGIEEYFSAMIKSTMDDIGIKKLLKDNLLTLSDEKANRELFLKCLDVSFFYEGFSAYRAKDFIK